ncbi:MAG: LysR family transcriptional regulator [Zoogloeaceae bacterium]|nr:LysR family transcriptional regulator [Zoogloeaceae bacterium]
MDKLKAMQIAVAIADGGSLTAAAERLDLSLPGVVRTLAALEAQLGVRLFNRTTRRLSMTDEGRQYVENGRRILADVAEVETLLVSGAVEPSGSITVTAPVMFGTLHVAPAVTRFVQHFEKMRVSLQLHDRVVNLLDEHIDVGVRIGAVEDQSLVAREVGNLRRVVVASPDWLRRHGTPAHPRELLDHACVCFARSTASWWSFAEGGETFSVPVSGRLEFNQIAPAVDACVAGQGPGMFISYQVAAELARGELRVLLEDFELPPMPVHVVYPHARLLPARTRAFIDWITRELREQRHGGVAP